jgi:hypothetical protein
MVVSNKFLCGEGYITLHYCKICGEPYLNYENAKDCEKGHSRNQGNNAIKT